MNIIIGAGFSGATLARLLADKGEHVLIIDKKIILLEIVMIIKMKMVL